MVWLTQDDFRKKLIEKWSKREQEKIIEYWKQCIIQLRQFCRGWGRNWDTETRKSKILLIEKIKILDNKAEQVGLSEEEWDDRYGLERNLEQIYVYEEIRWQRRGGKTWLLKGDSNIGFFHSLANGRRKKCEISQLEEGDRVINDPKELKVRIEDYYKKLFGHEQRGDIKLQEHFWREEGKLSNEETNFLDMNFTMDEVEMAVKDMKANTGPGPDGSGQAFIKNSGSMSKILLRK